MHRGVHPTVEDRLAQLGGEHPDAHVLDGGVRGPVAPGRDDDQFGWVAPADQSVSDDAGLRRRQEAATSSDPDYAIALSQ
ncbi:putative uncharacterized protein [Mycolicibacterium thermoresistibile]|uniref:Uncharacterized protein n=1 Tax=Mycolicibacterium thermoresistibile TaxID=1797 RepID=A0A100XFC8_MYCTH|nr:putative uncharacterized protein [Mycolicibacterium thermoresistibile]